MNKLAKFSLMAAFAAAPVMADEDFGGIGVTIYQVPAGVYVAEVIPGGPAADTKIATGDVIVAVDGVSLKGQNIEFSKVPCWNTKNVLTIIRTLRLRARLWKRSPSST